MEENALADVRSIARLLRTDQLLLHQETALNILGWIFKERGLTSLAKVYFKISLTHKRTHNAAILHLQGLNSML